MKNAWVLRPYPDGKYRMKEFLQNDIVAIGWPKLGDLSGKGRDQIKNFLQSSYPYSSFESRSLGQAVGVIDRFVNEMKIDDYVVVPDGPNVFIGKVKSGYSYNKNNCVDGFPHQRKVDWLCDKRAIKRQSLTGRVFDSLKSRQALSSTYDNDIEDVVKNKKYLFRITRI